MRKGIYIDNQVVYLNKERIFITCYINIYLNVHVKKKAIKIGKFDFSLYF